MATLNGANVGCCVGRKVGVGVGSGVGFRVGGEDGAALCDAVGGSKLTLATGAFAGIVVIVSLLALAAIYEVYAAIQTQRDADRWCTTSL